MADKPYKITVVQKRDPWTGTYGTFDSYALQLEGWDGWVEMSQKQTTPAPEVGGELFGSIEMVTRGDNTYAKFKKAKKQFQGSSVDPKDIAYIIMMLEELTLRRESPDNPTARRPKVEDVLPTEEEVDKGFSLEQIPF